MKLFVLLVSAIATLVSSQTAPSVGSLPTCAVPCIESGIAATGCQATDIHCFCTATQFLRTIAPCIFANCSTADQQTTEVTAQGICNAATPPVQLPPFTSLLNSSSSSVSASASAPASVASTSAVANITSTGSSTPATSSPAVATSHSSASGRIEGDVRIMMAVAAMVGVVAIAFFAV